MMINEPRTFAFRGTPPEILFQDGRTAVVRITTPDHYYFKLSLQLTMKQPPELFDPHVYNGTNVDSACVKLTLLEHSVCLYKYSVRIF